MYRLEFEIYSLPPTTNSNGYEHWAIKARAVKLWRSLVVYAVGNKKPRRPLEAAKLTLIRHSSMEPDFDGLVSSFKAAIDGLKDAGVIRDDQPSVIGKPDYHWRKAGKNQGKVTIVVEDLTA